MNEDTLSANELAIAQAGLQLGLAWWRKNGTKSDFARNQVVAMGDLNMKIGRILDAKFPPNELGDIDDSKSDEPLMRLVEKAEGK